eukprot:scaffold230903_cov14-Tisochrysis_lutea.AAC.1
MGLLQPPFFRFFSQHHSVSLPRSWQLRIPLLPLPCCFDGGGACFLLLVQHLRLPPCHWAAGDAAAAATSSQGRPHSCALCPALPLQDPLPPDPPRPPPLHPPHPASHTGPAFPCPPRPWLRKTGAAPQGCGKGLRGGDRCQVGWGGPGEAAVAAKVQRGTSPSPCLGGMQDGCVIEEGGEGTMQA